ncbi:bifunctional folylpolyglutamate synthase/dihydrofolate synthase [Fructobacillus sp. M158]|uniref:bifunctional folylpolyglutamate synthase/dihydrofolate synthase n=1 Tax=Fructobacillus parabroussonetiae TaxID=2713174 RepID=UPI00200B6797|nr:folylpolyglutamate synthase/dihydrofolate synthase family protein [Fructobacillus parabroussonetiae]MCK8617612.1 bifunctional folylpolyglutamate synthase/dihydrofolate synthase [Fructobacillus parabroussonetiae]
MRIDQALTYIHFRPKAGKKDSHERMQALLVTLDHPEKRLPEVIHVTGTNGKGSVSTMLSAIAQADGLRVGLFTSPYLVVFNDRFQINGQNISDDELARYTDRVQVAADEVEERSDGRLIVTEFEVVTAIMLCYFADQDLDLAIIEVGIGGRYDSTNVLTTTAVAVVTSIALDHQKLLGDRLSDIASQKAGIIKEGKPTVLGPHLPKEAESVIRQVAESKKSFVIVAATKGPDYKTALVGSFQRENAQTAVAAYRAFRPNSRAALIQEGLLHAQLPGRFEKVATGIFLDGAHNPAGLAALQKTVQERFDGPVDFVVGALADKHLEGALQRLVEDPRIRLHFFAYDGLPGRAGMDLSLFMPSQEASVIQTVDEALALKRKSKRPLIFTGSLYFIADVRRQLCQMKKSSAQS